MNQYGRTAIRAAQLCYNIDINANAAWENACSEIIKSLESQKKGCPKDAFLGLCEAGLVKGIPRGKYIKINRESKNKIYAVKAVELLNEEPSYRNNKKLLWQIVEGLSKVHNSQIDVVFALYDAKLFNI